MLKDKVVALHWYIKKLIHLFSPLIFLNFQIKAIFLYFLSSREQRVDNFLWCSNQIAAPIPQVLMSKPKKKKKQKLLIMKFFKKKAWYVFLFRNSLIDLLCFILSFLFFIVFVFFQVQLTWRGRWFKWSWRLRCLERRESVISILY